MFGDEEALAGLFKIPSVAPKFSRFRHEGMSSAARVYDHVQNERLRVLPQALPDGIEIQMPFDMVSPPIQRSTSSVAHQLRTGEVEIRKSLAAAQSIQPRAAKRRLVE